MGDDIRVFRYRTGIGYSLGKCFGDPNFDIMKGTSPKDKYKSPIASPSRFHVNFKKAYIKALLYNKGAGVF